MNPNYIMVGRHEWDEHPMCSECGCIVETVWDDHAPGCPVADEEAQESLEQRHLRQDEEIK